jgi:hypothetical protein
VDLSLLRKIELAAACLIVVWPMSAFAQDAPTVHQHDAQAAARRWTWAADGTVFFGYNYQQRYFLDYSKWESQNWFMGSGQRPLGRGLLSLTGMFSLEPFTLHPQGSPQLFQTGESYQRTPLVNFQHPHDFVMGLGAAYRFTVGRVGIGGGADIVGSPTLGPAPFMHRESARDNPQVPLTHHYLDSTHITPGVVRAGLDIGPLTVESSAFRGEEPNEDRVDLESPRLDSWAIRARWDQGPWRAQVSRGHMRQPEWWEPYDMDRITASVSYDGAIGTRPFKLTAAWGGNREFNGNSNGYLLEWNLRTTNTSTIYGRGEFADKELFGLSFHTRGFTHPHAFHKISALTVGYLRDVVVDRWGRFGFGADATMYTMPSPIEIYWASSHSYHVFLRWRPSTSTAHVH